MVVSDAGRSRSDHDAGVSQSRKGRPDERIKENRRGSRGRMEVDAQDPPDLGKRRGGRKPEFVSDSPSPSPPPTTRISEQGAALQEQVCSAASTMEDNTKQVKALQSSMPTSMGVLSSALDKANEDMRKHDRKLRNHDKKLVEAKRI